jgi:hypothetical protein
LARKTKSHLSIKPSSRLPACKTINLLPFPKLKKQLYEKIKFKKLLSVFKTDKIANLHGHEVLRTTVRHCELNPIELIWAQVKGFVAENSFSLIKVWHNSFFSLDVVITGII